jgi:rhodanese-related sulfurtransferase
MRDHIRKPGFRGGARLAFLALAAGALVGRPAAALAQTFATPARCRIIQGTVVETGEPTLEISTEQMEVAVAREGKGVLILDARPYEEFAMSHIPGAIDVAPKPGLPMSQYTSDVAEIAKLVQGKIDTPLVVYCNGLFCGKSKRVAGDLLAAGYTNVVRYQVGIPAWRALGHPTQAEGDAIWSTLSRDQTAVVIDAREAGAFRRGSLPGARNVRFEDVPKAKDDGRLPMLDHNTRVFVVGENAAQALAAAQEIARNAFDNVSFYAGPADALIRLGPGSGTPTPR